MASKENTSSYNHGYYNLPDNYIYISHLDSGVKGESINYWRLPFYPDSVSDSMSTTFSPTNALGRTAPVYTYSQSGPRTVQISIELHRDVMDDCNMGWSNAQLGYGEDYVDNFIKALQAVALPKYNASNKAIEPPLVALRLGKAIFVKGIVNTAIGLTYSAPILENDKYAVVKLTFAVTEVDPYDASSVYKNGGFRGYVKTLEQGALESVGVDPYGD